MLDDRVGEPGEPRPGRHAGPPAAEEPGDPVPLGRHRRRRATGAGAMAAGTAAVILLATASSSPAARRGGAGRRPAGPGREAGHV